MSRIRQMPFFWPLMALLFLLVFNFIFNPGFFTVVEKNGHFYGSLVDIFMRASPLILVSLGMTLVIATGGVDLSVGAVAAMAPSVAVLCLQQGMNPALSLGLGLVAALIVGVWNGVLVATLGLQPIVATLIAMVAGRGLAQLFVDGQIQSLSTPVSDFLGSGWMMMLPFSISLALVTFVLLLVFCRKTATGLFIEALGSSPTASRFAGLNTVAIQIVVYALCALLAGFSGLLVSSNIHAVDVNNLGLYLELDAILAVVIGGTRLTGGRFSLVGSVVGALIIQTVSTTINTKGVAVESMLMVKAVVVIAVCLLQSEALRTRFQKKAVQEIKVVS
jgi:simple sugar transport system permease protein